MNKALQNYECEGQMNIFDWLKATQPKECNFSGHTCNKKELWKVAHTFDDIECPETCCRNCKVKMCGTRCNGSEEPKPFMNPPEEQKEDIKDDYIRENPTCFYVLGHYLDREEGWHKMPEELPTFTEWTTVDVVIFGKKTGTAWIEYEKWEAKDWSFRSKEVRDTESTEILAWMVSDKEGL